MPTSARLRRTELLQSIPLVPRGRMWDSEPTADTPRHCEAPPDGGQGLAALQLVPSDDKGTAAEANLQRSVFSFGDVYSSTGFAF